MPDVDRTAPDPATRGGTESPAPPSGPASPHRAYADTLVTLPPPQRWWRTRKALLNVVTVLLVAVVIAGAAITVDVVGVNQQGSAPLATLTQLCRAESQQDYTTARQFLSSDLRSVYQGDAFLQLEQQRDARYGAVQGCSRIQRDYLRSLGPGVAAFAITVTLASGTQTGVVTLKPDSGQWGLATEDAGLHLY